MESTKNLVKWFRHSSPYINKHRGKKVVITLCGEALAHPNFTNIVHDISLLNSLGIRLVLVFGIRPQVNRRLTEAGIVPRFSKQFRITDEKTLSMVTEAVGRLGIMIESKLSMGLANSPMHGSSMRVCSGNLVTAKPLGIVDGIDHCHTGTVRRIDCEAINRHLNEGSIVLIPPLGYSATGEVFNLSHEDIAGNTAAALNADKLIIFTEGKGLLTPDGKLLKELNIGEAQDLLAKKEVDEKYRRNLSASCDAGESGIKRIHMISYADDGALIEELFTRDGVGTMITDDVYDQVRKAGINDIGGILELIRPLENKGILARRSRELLENEIERFTIDKRDGTIIGCAALYPFIDDDLAELACLAVKSDYRKSGRGDHLLSRIEKQALEMGIGRLFVLTTQTAHWFLERGFVASKVSELPSVKQELYNWQRNSRVFIKQLKTP